MKFIYSPSCVVPQIPYMKDVLYALRLSDEQAYFDFCMSNHEPYIHNVLLVAAETMIKLCSEERVTLDIFRRIIAETIIEQCPEEAKSPSSTAYARAVAVLEGEGTGTQEARA